MFPTISHLLDKYHFKTIAVLFLFSLVFACNKDELSEEGDTSNPTPSEPMTLKDAAGDIWIGMLYDNSYEDIDKTIFDREANAGQVSWYTAWGGWSGPYAYDFSGLNEEINHLHERELPIMMHMFIGPDRYLPDWFKDRNWTNEEMEDMMKGLIQNTMQSNDNHTKVDVWNVVNEAIGWDGDYWDDTQWLQLGYEADASGLTGPDKVFDSIPIYIRRAFEYARLNTDKELELRDYNNDGIESRWNNSEIKTKAFYQLARHLVNSNVPIDAVGFQGHFNIDVPATFSKLTETTQKFRALGLEVYITEMDAEQNDESTAWDATISKAQADYYYNYVTAGLEGGVKGIFTWGIRDDQDPWWRYGENPLLFDAEGNPKDSYYAVRQALIDAGN